MSGEDLLRGLPLLAAPPLADLFGNGPVVGDDGLGLGGVTGVPSVSQTTWGRPRSMTVQARSARWAATTQVAPRWSLPRWTIWIQ